MSVLDGVLVALAALAVADLAASTAVAGRSLPSLARRSGGGVRSPLGALMTGGVLLYRAAWSGRSSGVCRFEPSCSTYALEALRAFGGVRGGGLAFYRLLRCQPLATGGYDPVPTRRGQPARPSPTHSHARSDAAVAAPSTNLTTSAGPAAGNEHRLGTRA